MTTPEGKLTEAVRARLKRIPRRFDFKAHGGRYQKSGLPDVMFTCEAVNGRLIGVELKAPGGKPTRLQAKRIREIIDAGGIATYVDSIEDFDAFLRTHGIVLMPARREARVATKPRGR